MKWVLLAAAGCGRLAFDPTIADATPDVALIDPVGQLDPTFGGTGVLLPSATTERIAWDVVMRGDGYVVAGTDYHPATAYMIGIALTEAGAHDATWDGDGELVARSVAASTAYGYGAYALADGDVLFMGDGSYGANGDDFNILRVHADGTPATTFGIGGDGFVNHNIPPGLTGDTARRALVVNDLIYVCGNSDYAGDMRIGVIALRDDGSLEPGFQSGGVLSANLSTGADECRDIVTDGTRLLAVGRANGIIIVAAVDLLGTGVVNTTSSLITGLPRGIVRHADGRVVIAGYSPSDGLLLRYRPDLSSDLAFGVNGVVMSAMDRFNDVVIDAAGRYVAVGRRNGTSGLVARFLSDGSVDPSFGTNGAFVLAGLPGEFESVIVDKVGRIVAAGATNDVSGSHMLVVRLH